MATVSKQQLAIHINTLSSNGVRKSLHALSQIAKVLNTNERNIVITKLSSIESSLAIILNGLNDPNHKIQLKTLKCLNLIIDANLREDIKWILDNKIISHLLSSIEISTSSLVIEQLAKLLHSIIISQKKKDHQCNDKIFKLSGVEIILKKIMTLSERKKNNSFYDIDINSMMTLLTPLIIHEDFIISVYWKHFQLYFNPLLSFWTNKMKAYHKTFTNHLKRPSERDSSIRCQCGCPLIPISNVFHAFINFMANINISSSTDPMHTKNHRKYIKHIIQLNVPQIVLHYLLLTTQCSSDNHLFRCLLSIHISSVQFLDTFLTFCMNDGDKYAKCLFYDHSVLLYIADFIFNNYAMHAYGQCDEDCGHDSYPIDEVKFRMQLILSYFYVSNSHKKIEFINKIFQYKNGKLLKQIINHFCDQVGSYQTPDYSHIQLIVSIIKHCTLDQCGTLIKRYLFLFKYHPEIYPLLVNAIKLKLEMVGNNNNLSLKLDLMNNFESVEFYEDLIYFVRVRKSKYCKQDIRCNRLYWIILLEFYGFLGSQMWNAIKKKRKYLKIQFKDTFCGYSHCIKRNKGSTTTKLCAGCRMVYYCCLNHQKKDWNLGGHRRICPILSTIIRATPN